MKKSIAGICIGEIDWMELSRAKKKLRSLSEWQKNTIACLLCFFSLFFLFPAGALNKSADFDFAAYYAADLAKNHTIGKTYASLIVEPNDQTGKGLLDTEDEFTYLYGSFRESKASFVGAVNADKAHTITIPLLETDNLSFVYVQRAGFSNVEYQGAWKHQYYPLQLMFKGVHSSKGVFSFCYLPQSYADRLLAQEGKEKTPSNYESLIGQTVEIYFDGAAYTWAIADIYFETNYFFDAVHEVLGDFLLGYNKYPEGISKHSVYFMRDYQFQNNYYLNYAASLYPASDFSYKFGTVNVPDGYLVDQSVLTKICGESSFTGFPIFLALSLALYLALILFLFWSKLSKSIASVGLLVGVSLLPFLLFGLCFVSFKNIYYFSSFATVSYLALSGALWAIMITLCTLTSVRNGRLRS